MMEHYFVVAGIERTSKLRLFRGIIHAKDGDRLRSAGSLSYTRTSPRQAVTVGF